MRRIPLSLVALALALPLNSVHAQSTPSAVAPSPPASGALIVPEDMKPTPRAESKPPVTRAGADRRMASGARHRFEQDLARCHRMETEGRDACVREMHAARAAGLYRD